MKNYTTHITALSALILSMLISNAPLNAMHRSLIDASAQELQEMQTSQKIPRPISVRALDACITPISGLCTWLTTKRENAMRSATEHALKKQQQAEASSTALVARPAYTWLAKIINSAQLMSNIPMFYLGMQCPPYAMYIAAYAFINAHLNLANVGRMSTIDSFWDNYELAKKALPAALHQEPPALNVLTEQDKASAQHTLTSLQAMLAQQYAKYTPRINGNGIAALAECVGLGWLLNHWFVHAICYPGPAMIFGINMIPRMASNSLYAQQADCIALEQTKLKQLAEQVAQITPAPLYPNVYQPESQYQSRLFASLSAPSAPTDEERRADVCQRVNAVLALGENKSLAQLDQQADETTA